MTGQVASSVLWSLVRNWGSRLAGFLVYFQLVRLLTPQELGLFAAAFAALAFLEIFVDQGVGVALVQRKEVNDKVISTAFFVNLGIALLIVAGVALFAGYFEDVMNISGLKAVVLVSSAALILNAMSMCQESMAKRGFRFKQLAARQLTGTLVGGAIGIAMAFNGFGVWAMVAQFIITALVNLIYITWTERVNLRAGFSMAEARQLVSFGANILGVRLIEFWSTRGVELLIGAWIGAVALGVFSVGAKLYFLLYTILGSALVDVAYSVFSRMRGEHEQLLNAYFKSMATAAMVVAPIWALLSAAAPEVTLLAFGDRWSAAAQVLSWLAVLGAVQLIQRFDTALLTSLGHPRLPLLLSGVRAGVAVLACYLCREASLDVFVMTFVLMQMLTAPFSVMVVKSRTGASFKRAGSAVVWPLLGCAAAWLAHRQTHDLLSSSGHGSFVALLVVPCLVFGLVYLAVMALFRRDQLKTLKADLASLRGK